MGFPVAKLITRTAGTVKPIVETVEPREIFIDRCIKVLKRRSDGDHRFRRENQDRDEKAAQGVGRTDDGNAVIDEGGHRLREKDDRQHRQDEKARVVAHTAHVYAFMIVVAGLVLAAWLHEVRAMTHRLDTDEDDVEHH